MKKRHLHYLLLPAAILMAALALSSGADQRAYDRNPPFKLTLLDRVTVKTGQAEKTTLSNPRNPYGIFINYELGMHCVGFDVSYCCIIPPYNSIQAQVVKSGAAGDKPRLLSPADDIRLHYHVRDNSYSEGNKMKYWQVLKDADGNGSMSDPGDNMANYVWNHLFIYRDLEGTIPEGPPGPGRLYIGRDIRVNIDSGPSGKILAGGFMDYAKERGGNIVFTDSMSPEVKNVPLVLTASHLWDALGLPLTAFNDTRRKGTIRSISDSEFQPYQYAVVQLRDGQGKPVTAKGKAVEFFGTNPVDISNCHVCHSGGGRAATASRKEG